MFHSQVRPHQGRKLGALQSRQCRQGFTVGCGSSHPIGPFFLLISSETKKRLHLFAVCVAIALSGCGGVIYRSSGSLSGSPSASSATLSQVSCGSQSLSGAQTKACSVSLTAAATSPVVVSLKSNNPALSLPASVTVAAGVSTAGFNALSASVNQQVSVTISASADGITKTDIITLYPAPVALSNISCGTQSMTGPATMSCSVSLTAAPSTSTIVSLSSNSSDLTVPSTVTVVARATTAAFNIMASAVTEPETVTLTASFGGLKQTNLIQLLAPAALSAPAYKVDLSWAAPAASTSALAGYRVYRASDGSSTFQALNSVLETLTTYIDSTVQNGQTYSYRVTSVDSSGAESVPSASISVSVPN